MQEHIPVLQQEVIKTLAPHPNENFIDATLGFGGHAKLILKKTAPYGRLLGIDQDSVALEEAKKRLSDFGERFQFYHGNFKDLGLVIRDWQVKKVDGILFDLGVSTYQLLTPKRGFSFNQEGPLDMRMNPDSQRLKASDIVNKFSEKELSRILFELGEERYAKKIAAKIVEERLQNPITSTNQLVEIVKSATPPDYRFNREQHASRHFATSTFRALRMAVNDELGSLRQVLPQAVQILSPGGRIAVLTFHSLEDRIVKNFFKERNDLEIINPKPIIAKDLEIKDNPKSRSAKLRGARKI